MESSSFKISPSGGFKVYFERKDDMAKKLFPNETNTNRAAAGSETGIAGRQYPIEIAKRLNSDKSFVEKLCAKLKRQPADFDYAEAGKSIPTRVENVYSQGAPVEPKVKLRIRWKDGTLTNFRVTTSFKSQIHLEITDNFIKEFESQFQIQIRPIVKEALLLFSGRHENQKAILESIPVNFVGEKVRQEVEINYFNRLTLASMYGYNEKMVPALISWLKNNCANIFRYCFAIGGAKDKEFEADYIWYRNDEKEPNGFDIFDLKKLKDNIQFICKNKDILAEIKANDNKSIGSTITLPFGNLQQHENKLQYRHDWEKLQKLDCYIRKNKFGSDPKITGHQNEEEIAKKLNENKDFRQHFCERLKLDEKDFVSAIAGGLNASKEDGVIGKTTGKSDIAVSWKNHPSTNISIKKRPSGQVYLITAKNFIAAYEAQYQTTIPEKVKTALALFTGEHPHAKEILDKTDISVDGQKAREIAHEQNSRLMFDVISNYDKDMAQELLAWLKDNIVSICEFCFSAGAVKDHENWANILWYKNLVDEEWQGLDYMVSIEDLKEALGKNGENNIVEKGPQNAGSSIHLPFGHLQYHKQSLQFHQKMSKIQQLLGTPSKPRS